MVSLALVIFLGSPATARFFVALASPPEEQTQPPPSAPPVEVRVQAEPVPLGMPKEEPLPEILKPLLQALERDREPPAEVPPVATNGQRDVRVVFVLPRLDGSIHLHPVSRQVPAHPDPIRATIECLLAGPEPEELSKDVLSLIPTETRLLASRQDQDLLTLDFSEDFLYNSLGAEGYRMQVRQILATVAQFPAIRRVQFLIEGRRVSSLGEVVSLAAPLEIVSTLP